MSTKIHNGAFYKSQHERERREGRRGRRKRITQESLEKHTQPRIKERDPYGERIGDI